MKSSTKLTATKVFEIFEQSPEAMRSQLGIDLEASARATKAFTRARQIRTVGDLLRVGLIFGSQDWSYEEIAAWALKEEIGDLSGVAVRQRLKNAEEWFRQLVNAMLQVRGQELQPPAPWRIGLQDATVICRPGSKGTDARLHLRMDLGQMCLTGVEVTDARGGESFARFPVEANEIRIGDRGYAFASGMGPVLARGSLIVRINWQNLPLLNSAGERLDLCAWLRTLTQSGECSVQLPTPQGCFPIRLLAIPLPPRMAEASRARARKAAEKKHHQISQNTLLTAGFLLLVTNLPADLWPLELVGWLYRLRWQIELQFKRFKSLLHLDQVRALDPHMLQVCLLCKVLAILLLDRLISYTRQLQPDWFTATQRPISFWRLTQFLWKELGDLIEHLRPIDRLFRSLPKLHRHLCDAPRRRRKQLAFALAALDRFDPLFSIFFC
jgi:hypothetical protein